MSKITESAMNMYEINQGKKSVHIIRMAFEAFKSRLCILITTPKAMIPREFHRIASLPKDEKTNESNVKIITAVIFMLNAVSDTT